MTRWYRVLITQIREVEVAAPSAGEASDIALRVTAPDEYDYRETEVFGVLEDEEPGQ